MSTVFQLVIQRGPGPGQAFFLEKPEILIGRDMDADITIVDPQVSRSHARLTLEGGVYTIEDLGSTNGTSVDGQKISTPVQLADGSIVVLGDNIELVLEVFADPLEAEESKKGLLATTVRYGAEERTQVFISYSRKDKDFVQKLHAGLNEKGLKTWVDWEGIPLSADWWAEIVSAIEGADAVLYIISPDSIHSKVCTDELNTALKNNKRLIPVLFREPGAEDFPKMHEKVSAHNWIYMRDDGEFEANLPAAVETIRTDLGWVRDHTRLLERAVEWDKNERDQSFLLRGVDLDHAEVMLGQPEKSPALTTVQTQYIQAGQELREMIRQRELETANKLREQAEAREKAIRRFLTAVTLLFTGLVCGFSGIFVGVFEMYGTRGEEYVVEFIDAISSYSILPALLGIGVGFFVFQIIQFRRRHGSLHRLSFEPGMENDSPKNVLKAYRRVSILGAVFFIFAGSLSAYMQGEDPDYGWQLFLTIFLVPLVAGGILWGVYRLYRGWRVKRLAMDTAPGEEAGADVRKQLFRRLSQIIFVAGAVTGMIMSTAFVVAQNGYGDSTFLGTLNLVAIVLGIFGFAGVALVYQVMTIRENADQSLRSGLLRAFITGAPLGTVLAIVMQPFGFSIVIDIWFMDNFLGDILRVFILPALILGVVWMVLYIPWHLVKMLFRRSGAATAS